MHGPHEDLIRDMTRKCFADERVQAIWVGGSLAAGHGDMFSDVDFRIAVEPGQLDDWVEPNWEQYLPLSPSGGVLMRFEADALLHHLVLNDGTLVDFYVQDTNRQNYEPELVILASRNDAFRAELESFSHPAASLVSDIDGEEVERFFVDYWITTHKQMKAIARAYDLSPFVGLYFERLALLRAWHMQMVGKALYARASLHMLGAVHRGLAGKLTEQQRNILGMPSQTPQETAVAIEAIRSEMAQVGRWLAKKYAFTYPYELEEVVQQLWNANKTSITKR